MELIQPKFEILLYSYFTSFLRSYNFIKATSWNYTFFFLSILLTYKYHKIAPVYFKSFKLCYQKYTYFPVKNLSSENEKKKKTAILILVLIFFQCLFESEMSVEMVVVVILLSQKVRFHTYDRNFFFFFLQYLDQ